MLDTTQTHVSVIVTTYNWPSALSRVLSALVRQTYPFFEIIVADDGSDEKTKAIIQDVEKNTRCRLQHIWQPDQGFRAAKIRNKAVAAAKGKYIIFLDGDCVTFSSFVAMHMKLASKGWFVAGNRVLLSKQFSENLLHTKESIPTKFQLFRPNACNRFLPLLYLPFIPRKLNPQRWQGAKTCNLGVWRDDFIAVNGFNEVYEGWGYEDSDLVIRLLKSGVKSKNGRYALPVMHLWHPEESRERESQNYDRLQKCLTDKITKATVGIDQYMEVP